VRDSVIKSDTVFRAGAVLSRSILDKEIEVGANAQLGVGMDATPNKLELDKINTGITIGGKRAHIPIGAENNYRIRRLEVFCLFSGQKLSSTLETHVLEKPNAPS